MIYDRIDYLKSEMDAWVKKINLEYAEVVSLIPVVEEHTENIQHNYELICELRADLEDLRKDIHALKIIFTLEKFAQSEHEVSKSVDRTGSPTSRS